MATNYPTSLDNGTSLPYPSATDDTNSPSLSSGQDNQNDALIAVETLLGNNTTQTTPTAQYNVLQADSATSNVWGLITSNNVSSSTGSGDFVFATSPTISSPTISSPTISSPTITGSLGNISTGTITASGVITANGGLSAGSVNYAALLPTIFSGQLTSYTNTGTGGGTFYYGNIGGLKIIVGSTSVSTSAPTLVYPAGFFTTWASATYSMGGVSTTPTGTTLWSNGNIATNEIVLNIAGQPSGLSFDVSFTVIGV